MQIIEQRSGSVRSERFSTDRYVQSGALRSAMPDRPLLFSIDDRLENRHLTRLDLRSKNLTKINKLTDQIQYDVVLFDSNDITKVEHLDILTHIVEVSL
jgi:hypothetical protein